MNVGRLAALPVAVGLVIGAWPGAAIGDEGRRSSIGLVGGSLASTVGLTLSTTVPILPVEFIGLVAASPSATPTTTPWIPYNWLAALRTRHALDEDSSWGLVAGAWGRKSDPMWLVPSWEIRGLVGITYERHWGPWWWRITPNFWVGWPSWLPLERRPWYLLYFATITDLPLAEVGWDMGAGFTVSLRASYEPLAVTFNF